MSDSAHLQSVQVLDELRSALQRFGADASAALDSIEEMIRQTEEWLARREAHWKQKVRRGQQEVERASRALQACESSGHVDKDGRAHQPDCSRQLADLARVKRLLQEAEHELKTVNDWKRRVAASVSEYERQANRFLAVLGGELPKSIAVLGEKSQLVRRFGQGAGGGVAWDLLGSHLESSMIPDALSGAIEGVGSGGTAAGVGEALADWVRGKDDSARELGVQVISEIAQQCIVSPSLRIANTGVQAAGHLAINISILDSTAKLTEISAAAEREILERAWRYDKILHKLDLDERFDGMVRQVVDGVERRNFGVVLDGIASQFTTFGEGTRTFLGNKKE